MVNDVIGTLKQLEDDMNIPKNVKSKLQEISKILLEKTEMSIKINKALNELDEISDDPNLEPYIRTQIWNIVSALEKITH